MTSSARRRATGIGAVALLIVLVSTRYALRSRLEIAPVFGEWWQTAFGRDTGMPTGQDMVATVTPATQSRGVPGTAARAEVRLDPRRQQLVGVRTVAVSRQSLNKTIRSVGVVTYDETKLVDVNVKLDGWIEDLYVDYTGRLVEKGEPLFTLYSPALLTTQHEHVLALETRDELRASEDADARSYAERMVAAGRDRLALWDLSPDQIAALETTRTPQRAMVFYSPANGHVISKRAMEGLHITAGESLYQVADLSTVWIEADVYERELPVVRVGATAGVTLDAYPGDRFSGQVVYIYPYVEERTRTVKVRFELPNADGLLKPGMYANVELAVSAGAGLTVPVDAVLDSGAEQVVFVSLGDGYFEPRAVRVGQHLGDVVEILDGLDEAEQVATAATFFLDSESQLRAALQGFETAPDVVGTTSGSRERVDVQFQSRPDPPASGSNEFEVTVRDPAGRPIGDAEVAVVFFMAAMPTMNMPAMRTETPLRHVADGVYRGTGDVMTPGRWDVSVQVTRAGALLGTTQLTVVAR
ncbi:MAG: efflux RND transporter periplasmic adaptor subunit [Vicinamibacterales bacterium]|nr:efflux RND transporter periplasmic adaptor subunit [Vicinamibacterales bacterium]